MTSVPIRCEYYSEELDESSRVQQSHGLWDEAAPELGADSSTQKAVGVFPDAVGLLPAALGVEALHGCQAPSW